jgi:hypothetical protein
VPMFLVLVMMLVLQPTKYVSQGTEKAEDTNDSEMGRVQNK